jgi:hypothetical protein
MATANVNKDDEKKLETTILDPNKYKITNPQFKGKSQPESTKVRAKIYTS